MLEDNGATIDRDKKNIRFPKAMILKQVAKAPAQVTLCGRDSKNDLLLSENRVHLGTGGAAIKILDPETGMVRSTTLEDLYNVSRLVDQLENIHFLVRPCIPTDIEKADYDINMFYTCLSGSSKHVMSGVNDEQGLHTVIEMASMIAGSLEKLQERPFISVITSFAISPLKLCTQSTRIMQEATRNRIPVALSCAPMAGSTSPLTMAGTLAQIHAEQLAGITICQLTNEGAPLLFGGIPGMANLKTMGYSGGAVECGMMNAAIHQLAHHINVPNYNSSGLSDSKVPDAQAGYEKALTAVLAAMGGSNYIHHSAGMLESMLTIAHEQFVIDDEIIGSCCKVLKGIEVDPEHLALEVIDAVGPGGNFMTSPHTMAHMRTEYYYGNGVTDRKSREKWVKEGSLDTRQRAAAIAKKLLEKPNLSCIPQEIDQAIKEKFNILLGKTIHEKQ
jgi:trimethylamine--corrinoid protein Co-methyltransferase